MKKDIFFMALMSLLAVVSMSSCGKDEGKEDEKSNVPIVEVFPDDVTSATGTASAASVYQGGYTCDFNNQSAQKIYIKIGEEVKSINPNSSTNFGVSSSSFSFTYAPSNLVNLGTNRYSLAGKVKFVNQSVTTGTIKVSNILIRNNVQASFTKITITDITNQTVYKTDNTALPYGSNRTYTVPAGINYQVEVIWNGSTCQIDESPGYLPLPYGGDATVFVGAGVNYLIYNLQ